MQTCPHRQARMTVQTYAKHVPSCIYDPADVARRLHAGETVTMDIRHEFTNQVREALKI